MKELAAGCKSIESSTVATVSQQSTMTTHTSLFLMNTILNMKQVKDSVLSKSQLTLDGDQELSL